MGGGAASANGTRARAATARGRLGIAAFLHAARAETVVSREACPASSRAQRAAVPLPAAHTGRRVPATPSAGRGGVEDALTCAHALGSPLSLAFIFVCYFSPIQAGRVGNVRW